MGDRWTLELLLTAAPWIDRQPQRRGRIHLSAQLGAVEMVLKGCTACYDLFFEWPLPTRDGIGLVGSAYADVGMRAVVAPMVADRSFYEAIPGLPTRCRQPLQERVAALRLAPGEATLAAIRAALQRLVASTATGSGRRSRRPSRIIARTSSSWAAPRWRAISVSGCTAMSPSRRCRR